MSLSTTDLLDIRNIFREELSHELDPIRGELEAISNDIKEIYSMIAIMKNSTVTNPEFKKLSVEKKLLALNAELLEAAKQAGVTLPR